jgi:hypothetical protein
MTAGTTPTKPPMNEIWLRNSLIFAFLVVLEILGRRRRMCTRYYLVQARAQEEVKRVTFQDWLFGCSPQRTSLDGESRQPAPRNAS